jgi:hypothetical protein
VSYGCIDDSISCDLLAKKIFDLFFVDFNISQDLVIEVLKDLSWRKAYWNLERSVIGGGHTMHLWWVAVKS